MDQLQVAQTATFQYSGATDETGAPVTFTAVNWSLTDTTSATLTVDPTDQTQCSVTGVAVDAEVDVVVTATGPDGTVYTPAEIEDVAGNITPETTTYALQIIAAIVNAFGGILKRLS